MKLNNGFEQIFPLIFDSINEGVFTVDEEFRITSFNRAAEQITGTPRDRAIGRKCYEVFRGSICQSGCAMRQTLKDREPQRDVRVDILNESMTRVPISVSTAVLKDSGGEVIGGVEIFRDMSEVEHLRDALAERHRFRDIIGNSGAMKEIFALIPQVALSDSSILVSGPSGTGKELVAQAIHDLSERQSKPFIRVNCGALPDTLLESELFGYVKGAFTGAVTDKPGRFQQADGGTLFLDEIGDITPAFQVKLLRALEEGEIQSLGSTKSDKVDIRLVCATNKDLNQMVMDGTFREDLYYRVRVIPIEVPPLSRRRRDIPLLVDHFIKQLSAKSGRAIPNISEKALQILYDYHYPGNVRELRNIIERAFVLCTGRLIDISHLPREVVHGSAFENRGIVKTSRPSERRIVEAQSPRRNERMDRPEVRKLRQILDDHNWNRTEVAKALGVGRTTLWRRMKDYGLL